MRRNQGELQKIAMQYAYDLMKRYADDSCAAKIENWRNRMTHSHDVNKIKCSKFNYRQAKQIVEYAKQYILPMINEYYYYNP